MTFKKAPDECWTFLVSDHARIPKIRSIMTGIDLDGMQTLVVLRTICINSCVILVLPALQATNKASVYISLNNEDNCACNDLMTPCMAPTRRTKCSFGLEMVQTIARGWFKTKWVPHKAVNGGDARHTGLDVHAPSDPGNRKTKASAAAHGGPQTIACTQI